MSYVDPSNEPQIEALIRDLELAYAHSARAKRNHEEVERLILEFEQIALPRLLVGQTAGDEALLTRLGRFLSEIEAGGSSDASVRMLDLIAAWFQPRARSRIGIEFALAAIRIAKTKKLLPQLRKAHNTAAALCSDASMPAAGVTHALEAVRIAKALNDNIGLVASLGNLTALLQALGLYRETLSVGVRVVGLAGEEQRLRGVVAQTYCHMSAAAYVLMNYQQGIACGRKASAELKAPGSLTEVINLLAIQGNTIKNHLALDQREEARSCLDFMRRIAGAAPANSRAALNLSLSEAILEVADGATEVGITRLLSLLDQTRSVPGLYLDNIEHLIRAYNKAGNLVAMARFTAELAEQKLLSHARTTKATLAQLDVTEETLRPGQPDTFALGRAVALLPPSEDHIAALRDESSVSQEHFENLAVIAELREDSSGKHIYRVGRLSALIASEVGHGDRYCEAIERAARLHDLGKLVIRDAIITKPTKLDPSEYEHVGRHTIYGYRLLSLMHDAGEMAREVALNHHEYWAGGGYPRKLQGSAIPESARIVAVADCFESLCHARSYRHAWSIDEALHEIRRMSGHAFEPRLVMALETVVTKIIAQCQSADQFDEQLLPEVPSTMLRTCNEVLELIDTIPGPWNATASNSMFL